MTVLNGITDNYKPGIGDGENEPFKWIPVSEIKMYSWAFNQDKHIYNIINSL
jgi:2'-5' RNA ligase